VAAVRRGASIDLGTNTFLLLVADVDGQKIEPVIEREEIIRLGKGVDAAGNISSEAMARGLKCLEEYVSQARAHGAEKVYASGTSALRDARNREAFRKQVREKLGIDVEIISGEEEARYTYRGALLSAQASIENLTLIDIGGGSTEVVVGNREDIFSARSVDIGSVRLTERFFHSDPIISSEMDAAKQAIRRAILDYEPLLKERRSSTLLGVAGTITTLAAIAQRLPSFDPKKIDGYWLSRCQIEDIVEMLAVLPLARRRQVPGLRPERADVIVAGALILETFMAKFDFGRLLVSQRGLRYGFLLEKMSGGQAGKRQR
jgi:exopolyphosphatase/guanosine-5'-triphosphate,3'-diphosphate pyrophosphatase